MKNYELRNVKLPIQIKNKNDFDKITLSSMDDISIVDYLDKLKIKVYDVKINRSKQMPYIKLNIVGSNKNLQEFLSTMNKEFNLVNTDDIMKIFDFFEKNGMKIYRTPTASDIARKRWGVLAGYWN